LVPIEAKEEDDLQNVCLCDSCYIGEGWCSGHNIAIWVTEKVLGESLGLSLEEEEVKEENLEEKTLLEENFELIPIPPPTMSG
jgi:hypothetical protein